MIISILILPFLSFNFFAGKPPPRSGFPPTPQKAGSAEPEEEGMMKITMNEK